MGAKFTVDLKGRLLFYKTKIKKKIGAFLEANADQALKIKILGISFLEVIRAFLFGCVIKKRIIILKIRGEATLDSIRSHKFR